MKEYRQDAHTGPLMVWTILCLLTALILFTHAHAFGRFRVWEGMAALGFLIIGPLGLTAYLLRARHVWVAVVEDGLLFSGRYLLPWTDVVRVERRPPRLRRSSGPVRMPEAASYAVDEHWAAVWSELGVLALAFFGLMAAFAVFWILAFVVVPLLIVPVLEIYAPFGDRIRIHRRRGRPITLRDLRDADGFMTAFVARGRAPARRL